MCNDKLLFVQYQKQILLLVLDSVELFDSSFIINLEKQT